MNNLRWKLDKVAGTYDIEPLEAMEFFENEVERINKLFNYPAEQLNRWVQGWGVPLVEPSLMSPTGALDAL